MFGGDSPDHPSAAVEVQCHRPKSRPGVVVRLDVDLILHVRAAGDAFQVDVAGTIAQRDQGDLNQYVEELRDLGNGMSELSGAVLRRVDELDTDYKATHSN